MELDLLSLLAAHPRRAFSREQLLELAHHQRWDPSDRSVDNRIARLRRKIEPDPADPRVLRTIRGEGYLLGSSPAQAERRARRASGRRAKPARAL
jgi:two-component system phosphate regulon response regulator OmpR